VTQAPEMHGPPMYFTPDWPSAKQSVLNLAALGPDTVVTGHGQAMQGAEMKSALAELARRFDDVAVPSTGGTCFNCPSAVPVRQAASQARVFQRLLLSGVLGARALSAAVSLLGAVGAWIGISFGRVYALPVVWPDLVPPAAVGSGHRPEHQDDGKADRRDGDDNGGTFLFMSYFLVRLMQGSKNRSCNFALTT